ncbi:hypothetical protein [Pseudoflavonifractor capillosus]|nr:hypothetical protein [Pseudoflavonifractor capillosus]
MLYFIYIGKNLEMIIIIFKLYLTLALQVQQVVLPRQERQAAAQRK